MRSTSVIRPGGRGGAAARRAMLMALLALALAPAARAAELARADLSIAGISLEVDTHPVAVGVDMLASVQTIFGGKTNENAPPAPGLTVAGDLTGPGIAAPIVLFTQPGQKFALPALHEKGEYTLQNIRLLTASGQFVQQAVPSFATIVVTDVMSTQVTVRQLSPEELRARGITVDPRNYDVFSYSVVLALGPGQSVTIPYDVIVSKTTHEVIVPPAANAYPLPALTSNAIPPRFQPPSTLPIMLSDEPEDVPFTPTAPMTEKELPTARPSIPAAIVIPTGFGVLHDFFLVVLQLSNQTPAGVDIRLDSISARLDAPLTLRLAKSVPAVPIGQALPIVDKATGTTWLVAGAQGTGEWTLEALKAGTHTITIDVRATYKAPGQPDTPLHGKVSSSIAVSDPRFHVTFSHPDVIRKDEPYVAYSFITNLSPQARTVRLDTAEIPQCGQGFAAGVCRTEGTGVTELTLASGETKAVAYKLKAQLDGNVFAAAGAASDAAVGIEVKLTMGVSASGIPLSPATLVMPWYARYLDSSFIDANLSLLGLGYSLSTAPLTASTAKFPRVIRTDVFRRAQDITRAGQRIFVSRRDPNANDPAENRDALFNLALDLLDNTERLDRLQLTPELAEWDQLRRSEENGRRAAAAMARQLEASGLPAGKTMTQFADDFAAATSHRSPYFFALVHAPPVSGVERPFALSITGGSGARLDVPAEAASGWIRTMTFGELTKLVSSTETGEMALVGRWKENLQLSVVPQADRFTVDLIWPDTADGAFLRSSFEVTGAKAGAPVSIVVLRGGRSITVTGAAAAPLVTSVPQTPLRAVAAAQDLHLDGAGHIVSMLFNRPVKTADAAKFRDAFSLTTRIASIPYEMTRRNTASQTFIPGAAIQDDGSIVNISFDKALSTNATYAIAADGMTDSFSGTASSFSGIVPRVDNKRPGGILYGKLIRADSTAVPAATVQLYSSNTYQYDTTNDQGVFLFEFIPRDIDAKEPGNYLLSASADGKYTEANGTIRLPGVVQTVNLMFLGRGTATGIVRTSDGAVVTNTAVTVSSPVFNEFRRAPTDANGRYSISDLPVGPLTFIVTDAARRTAYATNQIRIAGETVTQDLVIQLADAPGTATVRVTVRRSDESDPAKSLVPNAHVGVWSRGYGVVDGFTDANGRAEFARVPAGAVSILASEFNLTRESAAIDLDVNADAVVDQTIVLHVPTKTEAAAKVTLEGTVTRDDPVAMNDTTKDQIVAGAVLTIPGLASVRADAQGKYVYPDVPPAYGAVKSMQVFDAATGRRGTFVLPTLVPGTNPFSVRLRSSQPAGVATMRVRLTGARGEAVTGYRVVAPYYPPVEFAEVQPGVYEVGKINVPQGYDVWAVPRDRNSPYGEQYVRGSVHVDFDGQIGVADLHLPGQGTLIAKIEVAQPCATPPCYAPATGPVNLRYLAWDDAEMSATATDHRLDPDLATGYVTALRIPAGQEITATTIDHPAGYASGTTRLSYDGDSKMVTLRLSAMTEVRGRLFNFDGQTPVAGAAVRLEANTANILPVTTDATGAFHFSGVAAKQAFRVIAEVTQDGVYRTGMVDSATPASGGIVDNLVIILREQSSVEGRVIDASGSAVPLARYWLRELAWPYRTFGSPAEPRLADSSGHFIVGNVFSGAFRITAVSPDVQELRGDLQGQIRFEADTSQQNLAVRVGSAGTGSVSVTVVDSQAAFARVANVEVALLRGGNGFDFATTDGNGIAVFDLVPAGGPYSARAYSKALGSTGTGGEFTIVRDALSNVTVALEIRGKVGGAVRDPEGVPAESPVKGAPVTLRQPGLTTRASTDGSGAFVFNGVPEGNFSVEAFDVESGRRSDMQSSFISKLYPERTGFALELERTASLNVKVYLPDDAGHAGALAPLAAIKVTQGTSYLRELQGNDLTFPKLFAKTVWDVEATELGGEGRKATASGSFAANTFSAAVTLVFPTSGTVLVTVRDGTNAPVADAVVTISGSNRRATLNTGPSGTVSLDGFALGWITVSATKGNVAASANGTLASHSTPLALTLNLGATASITGGVDAEGGGPSVGTRVLLAVTSRLLTTTLHLETRTDAAGVWRFDAIPIGGTNVAATCLGPDDTTIGATTGRAIADGTAGVVDLGRVRLDATPPRVLSIDPPNNANNVAPNSTIAVGLSEPVPGAFLTASYFQLIATDDGQAVRSTAITSENGAAGFVVRIAAPDPTPAQVAAGQKYPLKSNVLYRVVIAAGIQDAHGNAMRTTVGSTFTTTNYTEPVITSISPPFDLPLPQQTTFRVKYNKPIDATSFAPGNGGVLKLEQLASYKGTPTAPVEITCYGDAVDSATLVVAPRAAIAESSYYRLTISGTRDTQVPPNVQPAARTFDYFSFDLKKPVVAISSPVPDGYPLISGVVYTVTPSITDEGTQVPSTDTAYVDWFDAAGTFILRAKTPPFGYTFVAPAMSGTGTQLTVKAGAADLSGNTSASLASRTWNVAPNDPPKDPKISTDVPSAFVHKPVAVQVTFSDEGLSVTVALKLTGTQRDGTPYASDIGSAKVTRTTVADPWPAAKFNLTVPTALKDGTATLTATATDAANKSSTATATFEVRADAVAPAVLSMLPSAESHFRNGQTLTVELKASDGESGVARAVITIGNAVPVTITAGTAGSVFDAGTGVWTFTKSITVPARNADTRVHIAATAFDYRDNATSAATDVVYEGVDDPAIPKASWITPVDGSALPTGQSGWLTTLSVRATGNITQVVFTSTAMAAPVTLTAPKTGTTDVFEARVALTMPSTPFEITASISDGVESHLVELPITVDPLTPDIAVVSNDLAITSANAADYASKSLLVRGPNARVYVYAPLTLKNLMLVDGAVVSNPTQTKLDLTITDRLFIDASSSIDVTGRGYLGGWALRDDGTNRNDSPRGQTIGGTTTGGATASASHGGNGGESPAESTNAPYGSITEPTDFGAGGGGAATCCTAGGTGGGVIALRGGTTAAELSRFAIAGAIRADGQSGGGRAAAGAGGSIFINVRSLIAGAAASISSNGGDDDGATNESRGGGGGRVSLTVGGRFDFVDLPLLLQARGGRNGTTAEGVTYTDGGAGTVFLRRGGEPNGELIVSSYDARYPSSTHATRGTLLAGSLTFDSVAVGPRALARFDAAYTVADPSKVTVAPTALLLRPVDLPVLTLSSTTPASNLIQNSTLTATFEASAVDGIDHVRMILSAAAADAVQSFGDHLASLSAKSITVAIPDTATPGSATMKLRAVTRSGRSVETTPAAFTVLANTPPAIAQFDVTPAASMYAGHSIAVEAKATDDLEVKSMTLTTTVGTITSTPAVVDPATHSRSQQYSVAIPATTAADTAVQMTLTVSDGFPNRAAVTQTKTVTITKDPNPPSVSVSKPSVDQIFDEGSGNTIAVEATIADAEVAVKRAWATLDGRTTDLTAGQNNVWTASIAVPNVDGTELVPKSLSVTAADYQGNERSVPIAIRIRPLIDPNAPALAWTCGGAGAIAPAGTSARLRVYAKGNTSANGVAKVEFLVGSPATLVAATPVSGVADNYEAVVTLPAAADGTAFPIRAVATSVAGNASDIVGTLSLYNGTTLTATTTIASGDTQYDGKPLFVKGSTVKLTIAGHHAFTVLAVLEGASVTHVATTPTSVQRLDVSAQMIYVACDSSIDVTGRGFGGVVAGTGYTYKDATSGTTIGGSSFCGGGSHGGAGGTYYGQDLAAGTFGSIFDANEPGGAGGWLTSSCAACNAGGGIVRLAAASLAVEGQIKAGAIREGCGAPAGGGIRIDAGSLMGIGSIKADGGVGYQYAGSGGGGRVALYFDSMAMPQANVSALGGSVTYDRTRGAAGTVYLRRSGQINGDLVVENGATTLPRATILPGVGIGTVTGTASSTGLSTDRIIDAAASFSPGVLAGHRVFFNGDSSKSWLVKSNDSTSLTVDVTSNPLTVTAGAAYRGLLRFDSVKLRYSVLASPDVIEALTLDKDGTSNLTYNAAPPSFSAALKTQVAVRSTASGDFVAGPAGVVSDPDTPIRVTATNARTGVAYTANAAADGSFNIKVDGIVGDTFTVFATDSHMVPFSSSSIPAAGSIADVNSIAAVAVQPSTITGGTAARAVVRLTLPARTGGCTVTLASSDASATVPSALVFPASVSVAQVTISTSAVSSPAAATISATFGASSKSAALQITPPTGGILSLTLSPVSVNGGAAANGTVTLAAAAPAGGAIVALSSSNTACASVPATVTVAGGATSATFSISTAPIAVATMVSIAASYGNTQSAALEVLACTALAAPPAAVIPAGDTVWLEDALPSGATAGGSGASFVATHAASGTQSLQFGAAIGAREWSFTGATTPFAIGATDRLVAYALIDSCNPPRQIVFAWSDGTTEYRASWGDDLIEAATAHTRISTMPAGGAWTRLEVLASAIGAAGKSMRALSIKVFGGQVWIDHVGKALCVVPVAARPAVVAGDRVWIEDDLPPGSTAGGSWAWDTSQASGGARSRHVLDHGGDRYGYIDGATDGPALASGDVIASDVLIHPCKPAREIMLAFWDETGSGEHRAYWGENIYPDGGEGTPSRMHVGPLPESGTWTRLEVSAVALGLEGKRLRGIFFGFYGGEEWVDRTSVLTRVNVANSATASMSSTLGAHTPASRAVDGNTSGNGEAANAMSTSEKNPWLTLDLGSVQPVADIVLWPRTDCCYTRLAKFWIFASDSSFAATDPALTRVQPGVSAFYRENAVTAPTVIRLDRSVRYLRLQLSGTDVLQVAEVQAFAPSTAQRTNLAGGATATQSATNGAAAAERAVDGNIDGLAAGASFSDTGSAANAWWQADLGSVQPLSAVDIWNRTYVSQTSSFYVFVSDVPFVSTDVAATIAQSGVTTLYWGSAVMNAYRFALNRSGRYIRIQASGTASISFGEVQVWSQEQRLQPLSVEASARR